MQRVTVEPWPDCTSAPRRNNCCGAPNCRTDPRDSYHSWSYADLGFHADSGFSAAGYGEPNSRDRCTNSWHSGSNSRNHEPRNHNSGGNSHESYSGNYSNNSGSRRNSNSANSTNSSDNANSGDDPRKQYA
jgi:hypothetical protein